jgi:DNA-binding transcriptional regulator YdaS (Cro superfamily)
MNNPMQAAADVARSKSELARRIGVTHTAIYKWIKRGRPPAARVLAIESATGVSRHELRPDIYPDPDQDRTA